VENRRDEEENMTENIADAIREDRQPEGEMFDLAGEVRRLRSSLAVAEKWLEVARDSDEPGLLATKAEYTRDQLEEELSKTIFRMEVLRRQKELRHAHPVEDPDGTARAAVLSDSLLSAYCALRDAPEEAFCVEAPERERYAIMGALMGAMDLANAEMERCLGEQPA
jgi:hypothetical protein